MGPPASSNFYTREIKKKRHAGGHDADMGIPITGYPWSSTSLITDNRESYRLKLYTFAANIFSYTLSYTILGFNFLYPIKSNGCARVLNTLVPKIPRKNQPLRLVFFISAINSINRPWHITACLFFVIRTSRPHPPEYSTAILPLRHCHSWLTNDRLTSG